MNRVRQMVRQLREATRTRDPEQYRGSALAYDRELLWFLIDGLVLRKPATFPLPPGSGAAPAGVVQHNYVGRAFPEKPASEDD
jgi:hypothetical protein